MPRILHDYPMEPGDTDHPRLPWRYRLRGAPVVSDVFLTQESENILLATIEMTSKYTEECGHSRLSVGIRPIDASLKLSEDHEGMTEIELDLPGFEIYTMNESARYSFRVALVRRDNAL